MTKSCNNPYYVHVNEIAEIVREHGLAHAEFCVRQMASQMGDAACEAQFAELFRLETEQFNAA